MWVLEYILVRLLFAIIPTIIWTILSIIIMQGLYSIKSKNIPKDYFDCSTYIIITNYILMFLYLCVCYRENISLF